MNVLVVFELSDIAVHDFDVNKSARLSLDPRRNRTRVNKKRVLNKRSLKLAIVHADFKHKWDKTT